jgi:hypothetical protein
MPRHRHHRLVPPTAPHAGGEAHQPKVTGEIIPWFDPENQSCVVTSWVQKIEQSGAIHRWSDYEKICYMQLRLKGAAPACISTLC